MKIEGLYEPGIMAAEVDETLKVAAARMRQHEIGALAVFQGGRLVGIVTERDLVKAIADGADPATTVVGDYMTVGAVHASPETDVSQAAAMMLLLRARHLPVVEGDTMIGMVSARDLLHALARPSAAL